jgi:two-component system, chemotaxis family, sensor kinase CheA
MKEAQKYKKQFLEIAAEIELNLSLILEDWDSFLLKTSELDDLYRMIHSLKSGAAFLDMADLEEQAHSAEDCIEAQRRGEGDGSELFHLLSGILDQLGHSMGDEPLPEVFSPREKIIMDKARERGEEVFRVICRIDPAEPMKKARAFLVLNNLELSFNVIKSVPSLDREDDFSCFTLYITTGERKDAIRRAVDVDRLTEIRIEQYSGKDDDEIYKEVLTVSNDARRHPVSVEMDRLDEIRFYIEEIERSCVGSSDRLKALTGGISRVLKSLMYEPLQTLSNGACLYLDKLAERYEKRVELELRGGDMMLSLGWIQPLTEIFQQLIRNSLTHGIEKEGQITISGEREKDRQLIRFSDNGRGLDLEKIEVEGKPVLETLCRSGFTTTHKADLLSGRGMGLNLVKYNTEMMGGELSLEYDKDGRNVTFIIILPSPKDISILQYRVRDQIATVSRHFVERELEIERRLLKRNSKDQFFYFYEGVHIPLYEFKEPVHELESMKRANFIIIITYLTKRYALLADELLLDSRISRETLENLLYIEPADLED